MKTITKEQKNKLRELIGISASPIEKKDLEIKDKEIEMNDVKASVKRLEDIMVQSMKQMGSQVGKIKNTDLSGLVTSIDGLSDKIAAKMAEVMSPRVGEFSGSQKEVIAALTEVNKTIKNKPEGKMWPQYWNSGIRNKSFTNINPSISPFGITDYDSVALSGYDANNNPSTVTFTKLGVTTAVITLSYDGSGNLISAVSSNVSQV